MPRSSQSNVFTLQNTVVVASESDLPPVNGSNEHPLAVDTFYQVDGQVSIANNILIPSGGNCAIGSNTSVSQLIYTGGGTMFTNPSLGANAFSFWNCDFQGNGTAKLIDVADGGAGAEIFFIDVNFTDFADLGDANIASFSGTFASIIGYQTGFDFTISSDFFMDSTIYFPDAPGSTNSVTLNMGADTIAQIINNTPFMDVGENFLNITSTANDFRSTITGNLIAPGGGELFNSAGLDHTDNRMIVRENSGFAESNTFGSMFLGTTVTNSTETAIATTGVPVLIAGTWLPDGSERMTFSSGGRLTYNGLEDIRRSIAVNFRGQNVTGNSKDFKFFISQGNDTTNLITAFADSAANPGTETTVTSTAHGLSVGDRVPIIGTTSYNLVHTITTIVDANNFDIDIAFVANDATGTWAVLNEDSISSNQYSSNDTKNVTVIADVTFSENDFVELFTQNNTDTTNFIMTECKFHID